MAPVIGFYLADVAAQEQRPCPTGKFKTSLSFDECQSCPVGKYTAANASTFCFECPAGYHGPSSTVMVPFKIGARLVVANFW